VNPHCFSHFVPLNTIIKASNRGGLVFLQGHMCLLKTYWGEKGLFTLFLIIKLLK
jgi:hypothetical protein